MMKVTLQVNGRKITFSEQELIAIVEKHLSGEASKQVIKPTEGIWFEVRPQDIDQQIFEEKKEDKRQEETRRYIVRAFAEMNYNPEKYGKNFKTMMPKKTWDSKNIAELKEISSQLGDHIADWVEQSLEWAQRIANGESWESLCNKADTANWCRLVVLWNGCTYAVGSGSVSPKRSPASYVHENICLDGIELNSEVPLVVAYEK